MEDQDEKRKSHDAWMRQAMTVLIIGVVFALFSPWIFTRYVGWISFADTGEIGDTIGGLTAPIIGLVSAFLVFYAFRAQIEANKIVLKQIREGKEEEILRKNFSNVFTLISTLETEIRNFQFSEKKEHWTKGGNIQWRRMGIGEEGESQAYVLSHIGAPAIYNILDSIIGREELLTREQILSSPMASQVYYIFEFFEEVINKIGNTKLSDTDREISMFLVKQLFMSKIEPAFRRILKDSIYNNENDLFVQKRKNIMKLLSI